MRGSGRTWWVLVAAAGCSEYDLTPHDYDDHFVQVDVVVVSDVLFVIDDSRSMVEEQERLHDNFDAFLSTIASSKADFQVGLVTTDVVSPGAGMLRGGIFAPDSPEIERALAEAVEVGTDGDREEQGLLAAKLAIDGRNDGFPRPGAMLSVVVISDEDDASPGDVAGYVEAVAESAGEAAWGIHGIVGDLPSGCATGVSAAAPGPRYIEAITTSGGHRESICADDYAELLTRVGLDVAGLPDTFELSAVPAPTTLEVYVDGVLIPGREVDGWTYDPGANAITFHGRSIPRPGMAIGVDYQVLLSASE